MCEYVAGDIIAGIPKFLRMFKHVGIEVEVALDGGKAGVICDPSPLERALVTGRHVNPLNHLMASAYRPALENLVHRYCVDGQAVLDWHRMMRDGKPLDDAKIVESAENVERQLNVARGQGTSCCTCCCFRTRDNDAMDGMSTN